MQIICDYKPFDSWTTFSVLWWMVDLQHRSTI